MHHSACLPFQFSILIKYWQCTDPPSLFLAYTSAKFPIPQLGIHFCMEQGEIQGDITPFRGVVTWTDRSHFLLLSAFHRLSGQLSILYRRIHNIRPAF